MKAPQTTFNPALVPQRARCNIAAATVRAMRRVQRDNPELWAQICRRAAEIRERGEYGCGGNHNEPALLEQEQAQEQKAR